MSNASSIESTDEQCGICLNKVRNTATLPCGHRYCEPCVKYWFARAGPTCPECRRSGVNSFISQDGSMSTFKVVRLTASIHNADAGKVHERKGVDSSIKTTTAVTDETTPTTPKKQIETMTFKSPDEFVNMFEEVTGSSPTKLARVILAKDSTRLQRIPQHRQILRDRGRALTTHFNETSAKTQEFFAMTLSKMQHKIAGFRLAAIKAKKVVVKAKKSLHLTAGTASKALAQMQQIQSRSQKRVSKLTEVIDKQSKVLHQVRSENKEVCCHSCSACVYVTVAYAHIQHYT